MFEHRPVAPRCYASARSRRRRPRGRRCRGHSAVCDIDVTYPAAVAPWAAAARSRPITAPGRDEPPSFACHEWCNSAERCGGGEERVFGRPPPLLLLLLPYEVGGGWARRLNRTHRLASARARTQLLLLPPPRGRRCRLRRCRRSSASHQISQSFVGAPRHAPPSLPLGPRAVSPPAGPPCAAARPPHVRRSSASEEEEEEEAPAEAMGGLLPLRPQRRHAVDRLLLLRAAASSSAPAVRKMDVCGGAGHRRRGATPDRTARRGRPAMPPGLPWIRCELFIHRRWRAARPASSARFPPNFLLRPRPQSARSSALSFPESQAYRQLTVKGFLWWHAAEQKGRFPTRCGGRRDRIPRVQKAAHRRGGPPPRPSTPAALFLRRPHALAFSPCPPKKFGWVRDRTHSPQPFHGSGCQLLPPPRHARPISRRHVPYLVAICAVRIEHAVLGAHNVALVPE